MCGNYFTKSCLTTHIELEHNQNESKSNVLEKPKTDNVNNKNKFIHPEKQKHDNNLGVSAYKNHRTIVVGPSGRGKTYFLLKKLENFGNKRPIHSITRSSNQYPNYKTSNEIQPKIFL